MYASCVANGYFQQAISLVATIYANPKLLDKKDKSHKALMKNIGILVDGFLEWRRVYDEQEKSNEPTEEEMKNEQTADEMLAELAQDDEESSTDDYSITGEGIELRVKGRREDVCNEPST